MGLLNCGFHPGVRVLGTFWKNKIPAPNLLGNHNREMVFQIQSLASEGPGPPVLPLFPVLLAGESAWGAQSGMASSSAFAAPPSHQ